MSQKGRLGQIGRPEHVSLAMRRMVAEARAMKVFLRQLGEINQAIAALAYQAAVASGRVEPAEPDPLAAFGMTPDELAAQLGLDEPDPPSKRQRRRALAPST